MNLLNAHMSDTLREVDQSYGKGPKLGNDDSTSVDEFAIVSSIFHHHKGVIRRTSSEL